MQMFQVKVLQFNRRLLKCTKYEVYPTRFRSARTPAKTVSDYDQEIPHCRPIHGTMRKSRRILIFKDIRKRIK